MKLCINCNEIVPEKHFKEEPTHQGRLVGAVTRMKLEAEKSEQNTIQQDELRELRRLRKDLQAENEELQERLREEQPFSYPPGRPLDESDEDEDEEIITRFVPAFSLNSAASLTIGIIALCFLFIIVSQLPKKKQVVSRAAQYQPGSNGQVYSDPTIPQSLYRYSSFPS